MGECPGTHRPALFVADVLGEPEHIFASPTEGGKHHCAYHVNSISLGRGKALYLTEMRYVNLDPVNRADLLRRNSPTVMPLRLNHSRLPVFIKQVDGMRGEVDDCSHRLTPSGSGTGRLHF